MSTIGESMEEKQHPKTKKGLSLKVIGWAIAVVAFALSAAMVVSLYFLSGTYRKVMEATEEYVSWKDTAQDMQIGSDELTNQVRSFVVTEDPKYMDGYFEESKSNRRQNSLALIKQYLDGTEIYEHLQTSLNTSIALMDDEYYAMRLVVEVIDMDLNSERVPSEVRGVVLSEADAALSNDGKRDLAENIVYGEKYASYKATILGGVADAVNALDKMLSNEMNDASSQLQRIIILQHALILTNVIFVAAVILLMYVYVLHPVMAAIDCLVDNRNVRVHGFREYRYIAETYNRVREQNDEQNIKLVYEAEHDKLTTLYNRTGYDSIFQRIDLAHCLFILLDVDKFKDVNDEYGHAVGDKVLKKVSDSMKEYFPEETSHVFRIGGDEFSIIMENFDASKANEIVKRCEKLNASLRAASKQAKISLSIGMAVGNALDTTDTLFRKADNALYEVKNNGRGKVILYDESAN